MKILYEKTWDGADQKHFDYPTPKSAIAPRKTSLSDLFGQSSRQGSRVACYELSDRTEVRRHIAGIYSYDR